MSRTPMNDNSASRHSSTNNNSRHFAFYCNPNVSYSAPAIAENFDHSRKIP